MTDKLRVGVLGCGVISKIYLQNLTGRFGDRVEVVAVGDVVRESAQARADEFKVATAGGPDDLLNDPSIALLLNLTPAPAHYELSKRVLSAGKHLYTEKPLALSMPQARDLVELAESKGLRLAVAPDTLLGAGVQTCRKLIDDGAIGAPMAAHGFISIHRQDERYMNVFRGPLLDLGPYHVGAFLAWFGPVRAVTGVVQPKRQVAEGEPLPPDAMTIDNPANSAATLEFESGCLATLLATAEVPWYAPEQKVWGSKGSLTLPDPNMFGGKVLLRRGDSKTPEEVPLSHDFAENSRGIGVWDMAGALAEGRPHRLSPETGLHATEVMLAVIESSKSGRRIELQTRCERLSPMPATEPE